MKRSRTEISYLTVGRIVRAHGIKGWVEILPLTDNSRRFKSGTTFKLKPAVVNRESIVITDVGRKKQRILVAVKDIENRTEAESLKGCELLIPESEADKPAGYYWHYEIIGCTVVTEDGEKLGRVVEILRTGAADVYVVGNGRRYLIPATKEVIKLIDTKNSIIKIEPLPGLLDL